MTTISRAATLSILLAAAALPPLAHADTLCPIEVGGGGIKGRVFELNYDAHCRLDSHTEYSLDNNVDLAKTMKDRQLQAPEIAKAASAVASVDAEMKARFPRCLQTIVGSSGVAMARNTADLTKAVAGAGYPGMTYIDANQEAQYGFRSAVPKPLRASAVLIDIGGGNTKIGYTDSAGEFQSMEVKFGSLTLWTAASATGLPPRFAVAKVMMSDVLPQFRDSAKTHPEVLKRGNVYWVGGVAWVTANYAHPEAIGQPAVVITRSDIENFLIATEQDTWKDRQAPASLTPQQKAAWDKEWKDVITVFGKQRDRLVAGVTLMKVMLSDGVYRDKVTFPRYGDWIWAYSAEFYKIASPTCSQQ